MSTLSPSQPRQLELKIQPEFESVWEDSHGEKVISLARKTRRINIPRQGKWNLEKDTKVGLYIPAWDRTLKGCTSTRSHPAPTHSALKGTYV